MRGKGSAPRQPLSVKKPGKGSPAAKTPRASKAGKLSSPGGKESRGGRAAEAVRPAAKTAKQAVAKKTAAKKTAAKKRSVRDLAAMKPEGRAKARPKATPERAREIYDRLQRTFPDAHCALDHRDAFELLTATILSAQCTDKRVNMVTPALFARYPDAAALSVANPEELEEAIKSTGFFRSKAKSLLGMSQAIVERHGGVVPAEMDALVKLPGVGRKTANVVLGNAFGRDEGIVVDTHVTRVSQRLGLAVSDDAVKIEQELMPLFPRERWTMLSHLFIEHGRQICDARKPRCEVCPLNDLCPSARG